MKSDNIPSRKVAEHIGMNHIKTFSKNVMGTIVDDEVLYKISKKLFSLDISQIS
jgi:RimJ/RimL family protein N-acetyltransferase